MEKERVFLILSYFRRIDDEIRFNEAEIKEYEDIYYSTIAAQNLDGLPHGKGGFHSATETAALNVPEGVCETLENLRKEIEELRRLKDAIAKEFKRLTYTEKIAVYNHMSRDFNGCRFRDSFITASGNARTYGTKELQNWQSDLSGTGPFQTSSIQNKRLRVISRFL